jgi:hypothetical protein
MRNATGWVAAALIAAVGCGGGGGTDTSAAADESGGGPAGDGGYSGYGGYAGDGGAEGPKVVACAECKVTGGGQIVLQVGDTARDVQFAVNAIPEAGPAAGPGFEGAGIAAKGKLQLQLLPSGGGGADIRGDVDTIVTCGLADGVPTATVSGALEGGGRFTAVVTDGGEPAADSIAFGDGASFGPVAVASGNIQVHDLDRCEAECPERECWSHEKDRCEPCPDPDPPAPPQCGYGTCWCDAARTCEPCAGDPAAHAPDGDPVPDAGTPAAGGDGTAGDGTAPGGAGAGDGSGDGATVGDGGTAGDGTATPGTGTTPPAGGGTTPTGPFVPL